MNPTGRLVGEVAIVTGSSGRGTGTAIARMFAAEGARVIVTGRNRTQGEAVADELRGDGGEAIFVRADLALREECEALVASAVARFGKLTVLVNNATASPRPDAPIGDVDDDVWAEAIRINLTGFMYVCRAAVAAMRDAGRGSIVNITSRVAIRGCPGLAAYTACKGAQTALTRAIAMDYSREGIRCNAVAPGYIVDKERDTASTHARQVELGAPAMHLTRMPTVTDIASACVYLASDRESGAVTGVTLPVDGGGSQVRGATLA